MQVPDSLKELLDSVPGPPGEPLPEGVSDQSLADLVAALGRPLPTEMEAWLRHTNGPCVGPGGLFGVHTTRRSLDILATYELYPLWRQKSWLPVAGDGSGNYYVLDLERADSGKTPVYFVDVHEDDEAPTFVVASSLWSFLGFLLRKELGDTGWPFSKSEVLARDPDIESTEGARLPWEA